MEGAILVMGRDDFAQQMAGEFVFIKLPLGSKKLESIKVKN